MKRDQNIYYRRISSIVKEMPPYSVLLLIAPEQKIRNQGIHYPYRTSSDLLYLTGVNQENIALIIHSNGDCHIFAAKKNQHKERWEGQKYVAKEIAKKIGFFSKDNCHDFEIFWGKINFHLKNKQTLFLDYGNEGNVNIRILYLLNQFNQNPRGGNIFPQNIKNVSSILHEKRIFKDAHEIELMKKASHISAKAHRLLMKYAIERVQNQGHVYEYELRSFLEAEFAACNAELAYPSIVAGKENATILHYTQCGSLLKSSDLLLVDAGCEYEGYASDITRSYPLSGKFSASQKNIYEIVLKAQKRAIQFCKEGSHLGKIHQKAVEVLVDGLWDMGMFKKCIQQTEHGKFKLIKPSSRQEVIEKKYYSAYYMHNTSHYIGLDVHDVGTYFIHKKYRPLKRGMVFTIEPGLYFSTYYTHIPKEYRGIGIRIEDNILITPKGSEILTIEAPKEIKEIEEYK